MKGIREKLRANLILLRRLSGFSITKMASSIGFAYKTLKAIEEGGDIGCITLNHLNNIHKNFGILPYIMINEFSDDADIEELYILHMYGNKARFFYLTGNISEKND